MAIADGPRDTTPLVDHLRSSENDVGTERPSLSWEYVAAFFDGEGSIDLKARKNSIDVSLRMTQVNRSVLDDIAEFIRMECKTYAGVYQHSKNRKHKIHSLVISSNDGVKSTLLKMANLLRVKDTQTMATLDYMQNKVTGNEYARIINGEIQAGRRAGVILHVEQPYTRGDGIRIARKESVAYARSIYREMSHTPAEKERARFRAAERNERRGVETRKAILGSLLGEPKSIQETSESIGRTRQHTTRLMKDLYAVGFLVRERQEITKPFLYRVAKQGQSYLDGD